VLVVLAGPWMWEREHPVVQVEKDLIEMDQNLFLT
jgi:hypothetical protein